MRQRQAQQCGAGARRALCMEGWGRQGGGFVRSVAARLQVGSGMMVFGHLGTKAGCQVEGGVFQV